MIIVLGAMPEEISGLASQMGISHQEPLFQQSVWAPIFSKTQNILYGKFCGKRIAMTTAGVGKVQSALTAGIILSKHRNEVSHLIFTGVAGALKSEIQIGDLVVASGTLQHDVDATALNNHGFNLVRGQIPYTPCAEILCDPDLVEIALSYKAQAPQAVHCGLILSGDQFLNGSLRRKLNYFEELGGSAIEMEGAAVAVAASGFGVPHLVVRTISDKADDTGPENFADFLSSVAVNNTVSMVKHILSFL